MASLCIMSGYDMKVEMSAETYQVGAHFKALIQAILVDPLKSLERFFRISSSPAGLCLGFVSSYSLLFYITLSAFRCQEARPIGMVALAIIPKEISLDF